MSYMKQQAILSREQRIYDNQLPRDVEEPELVIHTCEECGDIDEFEMSVDELCTVCGSRVFVEGV